MARLIVFNSISLDGYFTDAKGDVRWAHRADPEWQAFVEQNVGGESVLVFGRVTYELMFGYWPQPQVIKNDPIVAKRMNEGAKIVFSRSLRKAAWSNTRLVNGNLATEIRRLKKESEIDMVILGSGSIVLQLAPLGLIDEYHMILCPVALGGGRTMFQGITDKLELTLTKTRVFGNGNVVLHYGASTPQKNN